MKRCVRTIVCMLAVMLCLVMVSGERAMAKSTIYVSSVQELVSALGSDREIVLQPGQYNITEWEKKYNPLENGVEAYPFTIYSVVSMADADLEPGFYLGGYSQPVLYGFKNLTLRAADKTKLTEIVTEDEFDCVLLLAECENVTLDGLKFGHVVQRGHCTGAVLGIAHSKQIKVQNSDLYGCGTYGYEAYYTDGIEVKDSIIHDCSYGCIRTVDCRNLSFRGVTFSDCAPYEFFETNGANAVFENCELRNLRGVINMKISSATI